MSLKRQGFVGLFSSPLNRARIKDMVVLWIEKYGSVEQTLGTHGQVLTQTIRKPEDLSWETDLQFRVSYQEQFTWIYVTEDRLVVETSGLTPETGPALCHDVLVGLENCVEIINDQNDRRLDELEAEGLFA